MQSYGACRTAPAFVGPAGLLAAILAHFTVKTGEEHAFHLLPRLTGGSPDVRTINCSSRSR